MIKRINPYLIGVILIISFSCNDFIEKKITNDTITLLAPSNNTSTTQLTHTLWWERLDGAEQYNLQIVEGSFTSVTTFILDSITGNNTFDITLYPGTFTWRVKGVNNGYETAYTTYTLNIDSTFDVSAQQILLSSPEDNYISNTTNISLSWNSLSNADDYTIEIYENAWQESLVHGPVTTTESSYNVSLGEGIYSWGIQGNNTSSSTSTDFFTRTLTIDTTSPGAATLTSPADSASLSNTYHNFTWTQASDNGTALTDNIYYYSDATATTLIKSVEEISSGYSDSLGIGTYYWRVRSVDAAGNVGAFSAIRKFDIF